MNSDGVANDQFSWTGENLNTEDLSCVGLANLYAMTIVVGLVSEHLLSGIKTYWCAGNGIAR